LLDPAAVGVLRDGRAEAAVGLDRHGGRVPSVPDARHARAEVEAAYRAVEEWRRFEPDVDLYVAPCYTQELPAEDADELEVRLRFSEFLRWVNLIGWAGLAIGNLQLIAPHDETALAAGLAWVRG